MGCAASGSWLCSCKRLPKENSGWQVSLVAPLLADLGCYNIYVLATTQLRTIFYHDLSVLPPAFSLQQLQYQFLIL